MGIVASLIANPLRFQRLRAALRGRHALEACAGWESLGELCANQPVHLAVVDAFDDDGAGLEPLRRLRRRFPRMAIVAYVAPTGQRLRDLFDMGRLGIDALVIVDRDDAPSSFAATLEKAEARGILGPLRARLADVPAVPRDAVMVAVTRAHERLTSDALASTLLLNKRALSRQLVAAGLPTPQRLITWGRLIVAAHQMGDEDRSADRVARVLHFPSGSAFRNVCQRFVHATPSEIRANGGAQWVIECMLRDDVRDETDEREERDERENQEPAVEVSAPPAEGSVAAA